MALRNSVPSKPHVSVYFGLAKTLHCCATLSANKQGYAYIIIFSTNPNPKHFKGN